ncbi:hypothetical protein DERP_005606 [Dermatophagoides pteronyssinus]|uniref:SH2 domain-containing protein n=1 Tax=Dermatophagoides pteronyssinus TaxID=6956 RepID=A0ABQ8J9N8_DERPT|nr:hypothetical protein DERP_005606 [Dermatophagoides pteronyssinus]
MAMEKHLMVNQLKMTVTNNNNNNNTIANENCYVTQTPCTILESLPYYYGCITREDTEWILYDEGCPDGMYLLRESGNDFVLSLCHHNSVLHYRINKLSNGNVVLQGLPNQTFQSPMELIETVDGLACKPTIPLRALFGKCLPSTHWKMNPDTIREQLLQRAPNWGLTVEEMRENIDCDLHFSPTFSPLIRSLIIKSMHELQPWYHFRLSRLEAEKRIESSGHLDGKFLVRERDESSYAICLSHDSKVKHYRIDILPSGNFAIQDGPKFESIIAI